MNQELREKLESHISSYKDITNQLSTPEVYSDRVLMKSLNQKLTKLEPGVKLFQKYLNIENSIADTEELIEDDDKEIRNIAQEELKNYKQELKEIENKIIEVTVEKDPNDSRDIYMEIRAGTGGEEAAIFAGDLYKMYSKFSEKNKWDIEIINSNISDHGGFKEVIFKIIGTNVYSNLKFESGTHRVQRVPNTETQGRVHTSASTVAVLPIVEQVDDIDINPADLRIDTYRASGAGGQHVNKTDSAVRVTHIPTGIVSECQDDRSQHKNKAKAMEYLHSRLLSAKQEKQKKDTDESRKKQVGSGDRSERIIFLKVELQIIGLI
jgi:peptide chain release factor 1